MAVAMQLARMGAPQAQIMAIRSFITCDSVHRLRRLRCLSG
jgi:hypothetical protein